jgi:hypothetical protein
MATIKFNTTMLDNMISGANGLYQTSTFGGLSQVLGGNSSFVPLSVLFIFQGTMPGNIDSVANIASQSANLLLALPTFNNVDANYVSATDSIRYLTGTTANPYVQTISNTTISGGTLTVNFGSSTHAFIPGQTVTIAGTTGGTNVNANWVINATPNANTWTANASTGSNGVATGNTTGGNCTFSYTAQASGTASWFILARWAPNNGSTTTSTAMSGFGSMMGNIGITGSGADLEIPNTSITAGSTYSSAGMYVNFPATFNV